VACCLDRRNEVKNTRKKRNYIVAFDYLLVINCHYTAVAVVPTLSLQNKNNGVDFPLRDFTTISPLNSLYDYQFSRIRSLLPLFCRIIQANILHFSLLLRLASLRGKSLTHFSILAYQAFRFYLSSDTRCHYSHYVNIFLRQIESVNVTGTRVNFVKITFVDDLQYNTI